MNTIKDMVKDNKTAKFVKYFNGELWYETECGFAFPVPISDLGEASCHTEEKALLLMRYIRKHIALLEQAQQAQQISGYTPPYHVTGGDNPVDFPGSGG